MGPTKDQSKANLDVDSAELAFGQLIEVVAALRSPDGCPWDKVQTHKSLCQFAVEEAFELVEAIETGDSQDLKEELGDFLFQVVLHAQIAAEAGTFTLATVIEDLNKKMRGRHPHVFGASPIENSMRDSIKEGFTETQNPTAQKTPRSLEEVWLNWEQTKLKENQAKGKQKPIFSHPKNLPALQAAQKIGTKTEGYKFDWETTKATLEHLEGEIRELKEAIANQNDAHAIEHEMGDVLFTAAQLSRHLKLEPEQTLRIANRRFEDRFTLMLKDSGLDKAGFRNLAPTEKERLWSVAKKKLEHSES